MITLIKVVLSHQPEYVLSRPQRVADRPLLLLSWFSFWGQNTAFLVWDRSTSDNGTSREKKDGKNSISGMEQKQLRSGQAFIRRNSMKIDFSPHVFDTIDLHWQWFHRVWNSSAYLFNSNLMSRNKNEDVRNHCHSQIIW